MPRSVVVWLCLCAVLRVTALPSWSWDTIQTYVHCANLTGEWNEDALQILATQPFVVFEKNHKLFETPIDDQAEAKIIESCRKVKAINPTTECYMYTESDWARTFYSLGHWFTANPSAALQCPSPGKFVNTTDIEYNSSDKEHRKEYTFNFVAYDFNNSAAREKWIERITNAVGTGYVDGAFIDGNRGGFNSAITGSCSKEKRAGWAAGLKETISELAQRLGKNKTLISNYPTPEALALCSGGMMERGGSSASIEAFGKKTCGPWKQPCLLDYHAQYFSHPADGKMASFLIGAQQYAYFGGGSGWGGTGAGACALWLKQWPEFSKPLGAPVSDAKVATATWPGAVCSSPESKHGNTSGCLYTREFATGTVVFVGQYLPPDRPTRPTNHGSCIYWSDGSTTSANVSNCQPKALMKHLTRRFFV